MSPRTRGASKTTAQVDPAPTRPLKRSASVASLPTPPRTRRNPGSRSQSRGSIESDSDDSDSDTELSTKDEKRRRTSESVQGADEDAFWLDDEKPTKSKGKEPVRTQTRSPSPEVGYVVSSRITRQKSAAHASTSLASPPPSRRHPPAPVKVALPVTPNRPTTRSLTKKTWTLLKDSPDNPFVDTPGKEDELPVLDLGNDKSPSPAEKPTVTYVFRGKRAQFANPYYVPPNESPTAKAKREHKYNLPLDHPDYSPDPRCPPRRLFVSKVKAKSSTTTRASTSKTVVKATLLSKFESDDEEEEEDLFGGDVKGVAKRLFVEGAGKGSVDAGVAKVGVLLKQGQTSATDDD